MKNTLALILSFGVVLTIAFSCKDKNNKDAITPDYSATGNPYPNNQTVTGTTTFTNPATKNTSFIVGDFGWSNPTCVSTSLTLRGTKDAIDVELKFSQAVASGTYQISQNLTPTTCQLTILNAPEQPAGIIWVGKSGSVVVTSNATSINAVLKDVVCTQQSFNFPQVLVTGGLGCSQ